MTPAPAWLGADPDSRGPGRPAPLTSCRAGSAAALESSLSLPAFSPRSVEPGSTAAVRIVRLRSRRNRRLGDSLDILAALTTPAAIGDLTMGYKVAVVGATGNVGREMLKILDERSFPADEVVALASRRSLGSEVCYGDKTLKCKALEHYDFSDVDICLMSAGSTGVEGMVAEDRGRRRGRDR